MNYEEICKFVSNLSTHCLYDDPWQCKRDCSKCDDYVVSEKDVKKSLMKYFGVSEND